MAKISARVKRLTDILGYARVDIQRANVGGASGDPAVRFTNQLDITLRKINELFERQSEALKTFNIVLFGRAGADKSTLNSAIARSNRAAVSQGKSDWTTKVEPLPYT